MAYDDPREPHEEEIDDGEEGTDAGLLDDEGGDEAEAGEEPEDAEAEEGLDEPAPKPGRSTAAVQTAKRIAREANEKANRLEREIAELRAQTQRQEPKGESPEQEAARLSLMTSEERMDYKLDKAQKEHSAQMALVRFEAADRADKSAFDAKGAYDPRYKRYEAEVEKLLAVERRKGRDFDRETILKFVLGERVMASKKEIAKQKDAGKKNVAAQRAQAGNDRSDRTAPRGRAGTGNSVEDLEKRLEGVYL
jgi:hypothetical protein